jgi:outer membrane protein TolC
VINLGHIKVDHNRSHRRESLKAAVAAARPVYELARDQYEAGLVNFSNLLDARRSLQSFWDDLPQSDGAATSNLLRLYKDPDD